VDGRPAARSRLDFERAADERRALAHPDEPEAGGRRYLLLRVEADAVVFDDEHGLRAAPFEDDGDARGLRVLADVVERLLRDAVEAGLGLWREPEAAGVEPRELH